MSSPESTVVASHLVDTSTATLDKTVTRLEKAVSAADESGKVTRSREVDNSRRDRNHELLKSYLDVRHEVVKGAVDRSRDSAKFVQTASAAIATLYSGLLTLTYSTDGRSLPLRGVYATVFLGLAVACSTAYLAFLRRPRAVTTYRSATSPEETALNRADHLTRLVNTSILRSSSMLRAAVVALAVGVALIPAPFVGTSPASTGGASPPAIPEAVAAEVADSAARLFDRQVEDYLAALDEEDPPAATYEHNGLTSIFHDDSWFDGKALVSGDKLDRNFFWIAVWGLILVAAIPLLWFVGEQFKALQHWWFVKRWPRQNPSRWMAATDAVLGALASLVAIGIVFDDTTIRGLVILATIGLVTFVVYWFGVTSAQQSEQHRS